MTFFMYSSWSVFFFFQEDASWIFAYLVDQTDHAILKLINVFAMLKRSQVNQYVFLI